MVSVENLCAKIYQVLPQLHGFSFSLYRHVTRVGECGGLPCPFSKIGKKCPNLGKKWSSMGKISHLKYNFKEFPVKKIGDLFPAGLFFLVLQVNVY